MTKKSMLFIACIIAAICLKAQNKASNDSLAGFDYKEFKQHLAHFKGTQKQKEQYIAGVRKRFINKKYGIGAANTRRNGLASSQAFYDCTNIGFEAGDTSTWQITGAYNLTTGTGVDPFGGYPVVYPGGGNYSLQLNNDLTTNSTFNTVATRGIAVSAANAYFNLHYAIDILDYPHDSTASAKFFVQFFDATGTEIPCPYLECTNFINGGGLSGTAGAGTSIGMPNAQQTACPGNCGTNIGGQTFPVIYQPWQTITADLTPYIGQNVTCQITCDWCIYQYDFAYCYIDADCSSSNSGTTIMQSNPLCAGGTTMLQGPPGMTTYHWTGPVTGTTQNLTTSTPGNYTLTTTLSGTGSCLSPIPTLYYTLTQTTAISPTVSIVASNDSICSGGGTTTLTASGTNTYTWSTGVHTNTIAVTPPTYSTYTITGTDTTTGCVGSAIITVATTVTPPPIICEVTTDSASNFNYNIIYWDKTGYNNVDSFLVYRYDAASASYLHIGSVSNDSLSEFKDTSFSIGGPNGGNPLYSSWKYKMAIRDTCGKLSVQSPYHQSMFVQQSGSNFSWNAYTIGTGQTNPVTGYAFLRDDNNTGNWHVLAYVSNTSISATDPNYASYPNGNWRIDALGFNCAPTYRLAGNNSINSIYSRSHSNIVKPAITGINQLSNNSNQVNIYPNPNNGSFVIETNNTLKQTVQLYDVNGNMVLTQTITGKTNIDAGSLSEGVYNLSIISNQGVVNKRMVIVR